MSGEHILIIEDDPVMLRGLKDNFEFQGYRVQAVGDGERGLDAALQNRPDLIILDIMLPKINGYEICQTLRRENRDMPIIMLTAKGQESDIVLGLNIGADDYMTKPFSIRELLARAEAFLRRRRKEEARVFRFGDFELHLASLNFFHGKKAIPLTPKEFGLLVYLLKNAGRVLTRDQIISSVWGYDMIVTGRSVDRCINTLRSKIETEGDHPVFIGTVREIGYRFDMPEE